MLDQWPDAAFELTDTVLCMPSPVASVPALSLEPAFRGSHGSLYKALARGEVDDEAMRELLVEHRPSGWPLVFAVDASTWPRCDAETSPQRGFYYSASKHSAGQPIVAGWSYQWIAQLDLAADSWTAPMDARRIPVGSDTTTVTVATIVVRDGVRGLRPLGAELPAANHRRRPKIVHHPPPEGRYAETVAAPTRHSVGRRDPRYSAAQRFSLADDKAYIGTSSRPPKAGVVREFGTCGRGCARRPRCQWPATSLMPRCAPRGPPWPWRPLPPWCRRRYCWARRVA